MRQVPFTTDSMKLFDSRFSIHTEGEFVAETRFPRMFTVLSSSNITVSFLSKTSQKRNLEINIGTADIAMLDVLRLRFYRVRPIETDHGNQPDRSPSQNIDSYKKCYATALSMMAWYHGQLGFDLTPCQVSCALQ